MNLVNFRDLGGIKAGGSKVKTKRLLRAGQPVKLNEEAISMLSQHGLSSIVDFRSPKEVAEAPVDTLPKVSYIQYDIMGDDDNAASEEYWLSKLQPEASDEHMKGLYRDFIKTELGRRGYSQFVKFCAAKEEGAILFHCAAGKDRTGFGAALLLKLLGADEEDIFQDFLLTNKQRLGTNKEILERYRKRGLNESQLEALSILYGVKREYLETAYETIASEYGDFETYIEKGLQVTKEEIERLKEIYLCR